MTDVHSFSPAQYVFEYWRVRRVPFRLTAMGNEKYWKDRNVTEELIEKAFPLVLRLEDLVLTSVHVFYLSGSGMSLSLLCSTQHMDRVVHPLFEAACSTVGFRLTHIEEGAVLGAMQYAFVIHFT
jgi:4-diphosphocytidyl-2C-methyl-D-erythritol kinase